MSRVLALCGGVGGAKLAFGLASLLPPEALTIVVNTGDDFEHLGLHISPDLDTVLYTLAGLADRERGWGLEGETWAFMGALRRLGGEDWFNLGDRDLATHVERTRQLAAGGSLSEVTATLVARLGLACNIAPMSDQPVRTWVETDQGPLAFQHYFVRERCSPRVHGVQFRGAAEARPSPALSDALSDERLSTVVICPSNPYLSIDPILSIPGVRNALERTSAIRVAVSPIIGGSAVKGPAAKLMQELRRPVASTTVARHYRGSLDGLVLDPADAAEVAEVESLGQAALVTPSLMRSDADRVRLAGEVLDFARKLRGIRRRAA